MQPVLIGLALLTLAVIVILLVKAPKKEDYGAEPTVTVKNPALVFVPLSAPTNNYTTSRAGEIIFSVIGYVMNTQNAGIREVLYNGNPVRLPMAVGKGGGTISVPGAVSGIQAVIYGMVGLDDRAKLDNMTGMPVAVEFD